MLHEIIISFFFLHQIPLLYLENVIIKLRGRMRKTIQCRQLGGKNTSIQILRLNYTDVSNQKALKDLSVIRKGRKTAVS